MHAHYFQHVPFEGLGSIAAWLHRNKYHITSSQLYENEELPDPENIDLLIVMGGPMSVNDEAVHAWLKPEKEFIRTFISSGKPVLGICLGAQLIASSLGAKVYPGDQKEIGWFPIFATQHDRTGLFNGMTASVFHWHGETFDLPPGAILLAESRCCRHQAFQLGHNVIGLQFHLETTPESARLLVDNCREELIPSAFVQSEEDILSATPEMYATINALMERVLDAITIDTPTYRQS